MSSCYVLSCAFNQDSSCFVCGTTRGFRVYTCEPLHEFSRREDGAMQTNGGNRGHSRDQRESPAIALAGMLYRTNIFALVSACEPRKVKIWDDQKGEFVGELRSRAEIKGVCLTRDIIALVTEYAVYVYACDPLQVIDHIQTGANPRGLCAIAPQPDPHTNAWRLACPAVACGAVRVQNGPPEIGGGQTSLMMAAVPPHNGSHAFQAHQTPLAAIAFNQEGSLIATASETGTVVRVFSATDGQLYHELRRGTQSSLISCLSFRPDSQYLAVASSSPTIHIFKLVVNPSNPNPSQPLPPHTHIASLPRPSNPSIPNPPSSAESSPYMNPSHSSSTDGSMEGGAGVGGGVGGGVGQPMPIPPSPSPSPVVNPPQPMSTSNGESPSMQHAMPPGSPPGSGGGERAAGGVSGGGGGGGNVPGSPGYGGLGHWGGGAGQGLNSTLQMGREALPAAVTAVMNTGVEVVSDVLKGVLPRYFSAARSFAQFHIPSDHLASDVRLPNMSSLVGPLCAFAGAHSNHLYVLHHNGVFYECRFDPNLGNECTLLNVTTWFAPRPDFRIQSALKTETLRSELEGGHAGDEWQIL
ncbi:unnamed protein product [Vitrella brassicaformis CCMP3155]|uniref:Autophagy-related protein 18 n=3 Tax=Vitrella brassicaformis TaxID=1169539 RepID=A0A0G4ES61_VITBC|nr:unnamed protein product [Vitrella brassicaformis CCMP3155]|eukprot:CEM00742.1 unnamed protein product [Vitrella brassicaformis CCMP3155]